MNITLNGNPQVVEDTANLSQILSQMGLQAGGGIAVAVNNQVVPRSQWDHQNLNDGDSILIITATKGG